MLVKRYPISGNIYKSPTVNRAFNNRFNSMRVKYFDSFMKYDFNHVAG